MDRNMKIEQGYYSILKYCPDTVRGESKNIGVVLINESGSYTKVQYISSSKFTLAVRKVGIIEAWLKSFTSMTKDGIKLTDLIAISNNSWETLIVTPPKKTAILDNQWDQSFKRLWRSFAMPASGGGGRTIDSDLQKLIKNEIANHQVYVDYKLPSSYNGLDRIISYYANSEQKIGVDFLRLSLNNVSEIYLRADAEANKVSDIQKKSDIKLFVLCEFSQSNNRQNTNAIAKQIITSANVECIQTALEAKQILTGIT